jgi:hypothetical protein
MIEITFEGGGDFPEAYRRLRLKRLRRGFFEFIQTQPI